MKVKEEDINKVLALFDKEDKDYINFDYLINNHIIEYDTTKKSYNTNVKVKKIGGRNDRRRK